MLLLTKIYTTAHVKLSSLSQDRLEMIKYFRLTRPVIMLLNQTAWHPQNKDHTKWKKSLRVPEGSLLASSSIDHR